ncbi:MAG: dTDP-4-dehydrorhamnose 3,5-epimerase [Vicinamibacteraceae bacterium]
MGLTFRRTKLADAYVVGPDRHEDDRGAFTRTYSEDEFVAQGIAFHVVQTSVSFNRHERTLRGLHMRDPEDDEERLVRCTAGVVFDVIVDMRQASPTFLQHFSIELTAAEQLSLFVPRGFAHGFITLAPESEMLYYMSRAYRPSADRGIRWDDPTIAVPWPVAPAIMSSRDRHLPYWPRLK